MSSAARHIKIAPVLLLSLLAIGNSVQVGCGGSIENNGKRDDATRENAPDGSSPGTGGCNPYGYGYGCDGYGYDDR